MMNEMFFVYQC